MGRFTRFLAEQKQYGLTIFDIDDTLFHTSAKVGVVRDGARVKELTSADYNHYKLQPGESYDYSQFRSSEHFHKTSKPIGKMVAKLKAILKNAKKTEGSRVIIVTARSDFDDKDLFLDAFRKFGIDIDSIRVERAGNLQGRSSENKKQVFIKYLEQGIYGRMRLFDDHHENLDALLSLQSEYPDVKFEAYLVKPDGSSSVYRGHSG